MRTVSLHNALKKIDESGGVIAKDRNWTIILGGYDFGYHVLYKGDQIIRVNYRLKEYSWLNNESIHLTKGTKKRIKKALECSSFDCSEF